MRRPRQSGGSVLADRHLGRPGVPALPCPLGGAIAVHKRARQNWSCFVTRDGGAISGVAHTRRCAAGAHAAAVRCSVSAAAMTWRRSARNALPCLSLLHKHAAAIHRVHLAPGEAQFAQPVQGAGDGGLGDVELRRQAAHRMRASGQIDGEEDAKLAAGEIGFVATSLIPSFRAGKFRDEHAGL